jgi:hypothetical protein
VFRLVYDELRVMARRRARRMRAGDSVGPTVLVHEVYLRFADRSAPNVLNRDHFIATASRAMRMVLVDHWRRKHSLKRSPGAVSSIDIEAVPAPDPMPAVDLPQLVEGALRAPRIGLEVVLAREGQNVAVGAELAVLRRAAPAARLELHHCRSDQRRVGRRRGRRVASGTGL